MYVAPSSFPTSSYIERLHAPPVCRCWLLLLQNFGEFGPVKRIHIVPTKTIAFVKYHWRVSAEFAREAMDQQQLTGSTLNEVGVVGSVGSCGPTAGSSLEDFLRPVSIKAATGVCRPSCHESAAGCGRELALCSARKGVSLP